MDLCNVYEWWLSHFLSILYFPFILITIAVCFMTSRMCSTTLFERDYHFNIVYALLTKKYCSVYLGCICYDLNLILFFFTIVVLMPADVHFLFVLWLITCLRWPLDAYFTCQRLVDYFYLGVGRYGTCIEL